MYPYETAISFFGVEGKHIIQTESANRAVIYFFFDHKSCLFAGTLAYLTNPAVAALVGIHLNQVQLKWFVLLF